jgi:RHS repeat-associated protein
MIASRRLRVLVSVVTVLVGAQLRAPLARAKGIEATHLSLPKGPGSIEGLGRNFVPSLASGTSSYGVDLTVPPGAGTFAPKLSLDYDSGGGVSDLGIGWRIGGIPQIRRRTEDGLPRFTAADALEIDGFGTSCDLLEITAGMFRPEYESGSFVRVVRSADGKTFEARDKAGTTYRFGGDGYVEAEGADVATWLLREQLDLYGHSIKYTWNTEGGHASLERVTYNDFSPDARNEILFHNEARPDVHQRFSNGIKQRIARRASSIEVMHGGKLVRRYTLTYSPGLHGQLATVTLVGTDGTTAMPTLTLGYSTAKLSTDAGGLVAMTTPPGRSPSDGNTELADLNGDGLPDLLVTKAGAFRSYLNHDGHAWKAPIDWSASASPSLELAAVGVQLADLDGDGALDLVAKSGTADLRYFPGKDETSFGAAIHTATVPNFTFEDPDVRLADMDGDRRTDVLITSAAGLAIAYNKLGVDWTVPTTVGVIDPSQPLRFSDGHTQLCDVNGDRIQDMCLLRSGAMTYWLGRGRGRFDAAATASGVPAFDASSPWQLVDLDGDGWVDLVHPGVAVVEIALATAEGVFGPPQTIAGTPTKGPSGTVRFADMNGTGTTDIVWIDVTTTPEVAWQYLELFPEGRGGLLRTIDNGLGKHTTITYGAASADAATARDAGRAWAARMNAAIPVVKHIEVDASLGDPVLRTEYVYRDGTFAPVERTFAGFAGGTETAVGDEHTPTLVTESTFDVGLSDRTLRGVSLTSEARTAAGGVFTRTTSSWTTRAIDVAADGRKVKFSFKSSELADHVEGSEASKRTTLSEWDYDAFGNPIREANWGEVVAGDKLAGNDESVTIRTFANNVDDWILGRLATEEVQDASSTRLRLRRLYYDGAPFTGLSLGQVSRGAVTRQEHWVGPTPDTFELDVARAYDSDGHPVETRDALGGGRKLAFAGDHTTLLSETVKLADREFVEVAGVDPAFGNLLSVTAYDGQVSRFVYDPLGRVTDVYKPGDPDGQPSIRYTYVEHAPLSRIITERRIWTGRPEIEHSETLFDSLSRKRGALLREDGGKWVFTAVGLLDQRGQARKSLRARWISDDEAKSPPITTDAVGVESWRDALGRGARTRTPMGIESRTSFEPFVTKQWDGAQIDPASHFEHTPHVRTVDGLGRLIESRESLHGAPVATRYEYDAAGALLTRFDPEGHKSFYRYDGAGRRTLLHDADAGEYQFKYDATGNTVETVHPDGVHSRSVFDLGGRVIEEDWDGDGTPEVRKVWDRSERHPGDPLYIGKLVTVDDPGGRVETEYDARGRAASIHHTIDGATYEVQAHYDALDREVLHVYPDGSSIQIHRNARGQLSGYGDALTFEYDGDGLETRRAVNTGVTQLRGYDDDRRVHDTIAKSADGSEILHLSWEYDGAGNITSIHDRRPGVTPDRDRSETYEYDNLYRLETAKGTWGNASWKYSPSGNLLRRESSVPALQALDIAYGSGAGPHAMTRFNGRTVTYDPRGRMASDGDRTYSWNGADQLIGVKRGDGNAVESRFNLNDERTLRVERRPDGTESRTHFIDAWAEVQDGKLSRFIVHGGQRIARLAESNGTSGAAGATGASKSALTTARDAGGHAAPPPSGQASRLANVVQTGQLSLMASVLLALSWTRRRRLSAHLSAAVLLLGVLSFGAINCTSAPQVDAPTPIEGGSVSTLGPNDELFFSDQLGTLAEQTSGTGVAGGTFAAFPFGLTRYDTSHETRKYANSPRDGGVGVDSMGSRSYAPDLGVWLSADPVSVHAPEQAVGAAAAAANPYAYAGLTPIIAKDEKGQWFAEVLVGAFIGAAIGGGVEAYRVYQETGSIAWSDAGRIGAKAAGGAVAGAVTAAVPTVALSGAVGIGAVSGVVSGVVERAIEGKETTWQAVAGDAAAGGAGGAIGFGLGKLVGPVLQRASAKMKGFVSSIIGGGCFVAGTAVATSSGSVPIEHVHLGDRVTVGNPACAGDHIAVSERTLRLSLPNPDVEGDEIRVALMRDVHWLVDQDVGEDRELWLSLPEVGIAGWAHLDAIEPPPLEQAGAGCLVRMTVLHRASAILRIRVGDSAPIEVTPSHPLYEVGVGWVTAGELDIGAILATEYGPQPVVEIDEAEGGREVFNLEISVDHTYRVGELGVWAHNTCPPKTLKPGPFAAGKIPARGPGRDFTPGERAATNTNGKATGCHTCGEKNPGTKSGDFIPDHQPPTKLAPPGTPQDLYPHCLGCSRKQGGEVNGQLTRGT